MLKPRFRPLRKAARHTKEAMAAALGVTVRTIDAWEKAERNPRGRTLYQIAEFLGVSVEDLYERVAPGA